MSGLFWQQNLDRLATPEHASIGSRSGFIENTAAGFWAGRAVENPFSEEALTSELEAERQEQIKQATGAKTYLDAIQPYLARVKQERRQRDRPGFVQAFGELWTGAPQEDTERAIELLVADLAKPHAGAGIAYGNKFRQKVLDTALQRDAERAETLARSRGSWGGFLGSLTGGMGAFATDPLNAASMTLGAPARAGLLGTMAIEAAIGGGTSLATAPKVQAFKSEVGVESGLGVALRDAAVDAGFAGALGGIFKSAQIGYNKLRSTREVLEEFDRAIPDPTPDQLAIRNELEAISDFSEANPFTSREGFDPAQADAEHAGRMGEIITAMEEGTPLPRFPEDAQALSPMQELAWRRQVREELAQSGKYDPEDVAWGLLLTKSDEELRADYDALVGSGAQPPRTALEAPETPTSARNVADEAVAPETPQRAPAGTAEPAMAGAADDAVADVAAQPDTPQVQESRFPFEKYGARVGESRQLENSTLYPLLDEAGVERGSLTIRETPEEIIIDGAAGGKRGGIKGQASRAIKALIEDASRNGKTVRATNTGGANAYWSGAMGFVADSGDHIMTPSQLQKILRGDITTTVYPHQRGYGDMFVDTYGPMVDVPNVRDTPQPIETPQQAYTGPIEPDDIASIRADADRLNAELQELTDSGAITGLTEESGDVIPLADLLDEFSADEEFMAQLRICTR